MEQDIKIVLCIPGNWHSEAELPVIEGVVAELRSHDHHLTHSFKHAGLQRFSEQELQAIEKHTSVVYISGKGGSFSDAEKMMQAGQALLQNGGLGIKVETSGKAFNASTWEELVNMDHEHRFYEAFVLLVKGADNSIHSCGMHNLGLRDTLSDAIGEVMDTAELVDIFCIYQILEEPDIKEGQTFSTDPDSPVYIINEEPCTYYAPGDHFYNPYGIIHLRRAD